MAKGVHFAKGLSDHMGGWSFRKGVGLPCLVCYLTYVRCVTKSILSLLPKVVVYAVTRPDHVGELGLPLVPGGRQAEDQYFKCGVRQGACDRDDQHCK